MRTNRRSIGRCSRVILMCGCMVLPAAAQDPSPAAEEPVAGKPVRARPRIGLALGGGGALGIAHVGVLKVLEELRIPIDCIAGTSMGAVIGGLYAAGLSPEEIERLLLSVDWWDLLEDNAAREYLVFRNKQDTARYLFNAEAGYRPPLEFILPHGLSSGLKLGIVMRRETASVASIRHFDALRVPYRAVATDLLTGDEVILDRGSLVEAMRASMAVPGVFTPVERDGRVLVDGGVVNNLPVDALKAMGAAVIIAVDVRAAKADALKKNVVNMADVLAQTYMLIQRPRADAQLEKADIAILPDLVAFGAADFHRAAHLIPAGEDAARACRDELAKLSLSPGDYAAHAARQRRVPREAMRVRAVRIAGNERVDVRAIEAMVRTQPGAEVDFDQLETDVYRIHGMGDFVSVSYRLDSPASGDGYDVVYTVEEKPWGPGYLHFGLRLESVVDDKATWHFLLNYKYTRINRLGAELRLDVETGSNHRGDVEFYQPLTPSASFFLAPRAAAGSTHKPVYEDNRKIGEYEIELVEAEIVGGMTLGNSGELRVGAVAGRGRAEISTGDRDIPEFSGTIAALIAELAVDRLDNAVFARSGCAIRARAFLARPYLGANRNYDKVSVAFEQNASSGRHSVRLGLLAASSLGSDVPAYDRFTLGGIESMAGYAPEQVSGRYAALLQIGYRYELARLPPTVGRGVYVLVRQDIGNAWDSGGDIALDDLRYSLCAILAADTVIGPCGVGVAVADRGNHRAFLSIGTIF